ncbi:MAG TPA: TAXI family TRAP transporter solute-binding subunit [Methylocella sp.]|nr:TAXI family TRAP transporter solute-binding subunit [Methylocella sp.]
MRFGTAGESARIITDPNSDVSGVFLFSGVLTSEKAPNIVSLGRINAAPFWIFYRGSETLDRLSQLKGKRAYVTVAAGDLVDRILAANGVKPGDMAVSPERGAPEAVKLMQSGEMDVAILPPIDLNAPSIQTMLRDPNIRLMNVTQAEAITRLFPSLNKLVLPQGVIDLEKNIPPSDVSLIGSTSVFVVRKDLHPELIYLLAQALKEEHSSGGVFQRPGEFPSVNDPELPMAEEAIDYYRNGPSFLQRYLPFWTINYAKRVAAIVVTAVAIIIPLFTYSPRLYAWLVNLRLARLYRRLRLVNARLKSDLSTKQMATLQTELESIDRAANILPMRHSDLFFALLMHIDMTRTRLASRLVRRRA